MKPLKEFIIPFVGLKLGKHHFDYHIGETFFEYFEFDEFNTINVNLMQLTLMLIWFLTKNHLFLN